MTRIAIAHPDGVTDKMIAALRVKGCEHPLLPRVRHEDKKWDCHCWKGVEVYRILASLVKRGMIRLDEDERYYLTAKGWKLLDHERRAPVAVTEWTRLGTPRSVSIRNSQRAEFQVLHSKSP